MLALALFAMFAALGTWQVERRSWKLDLIAHVEQRLDAAAVVAPGRARWPKLDREQDEYRKLFVGGVFLDGHETLVQAVTAKGPGFWLMAPLRVARSEERRVGKEGVSRCRSRWARYH